MGPGINVDVFLHRSIWVVYDPSRPKRVNMCISAKAVKEIENMALLIINHFSLQRMSIREALARAKYEKNGNL